MFRINFILSLTKFSNGPNTHTHTERERERERERETDRQTDRQTETHAYTHSETDTQTQTHTQTYIYTWHSIYIRGSLNKFPDFFFCMGTFIDSTHEILVPFEVISSSCNALVVPFQQPLEDPMEVLFCECVYDLCHGLFHLLNCLITTASELRE